MNTIWYEPLLHALRHHIEQNHLDQENALNELKYTEEYLYYESFKDGENVQLTCPWSQHCNCTWEVSGQLNFKLDPTTLKLIQTKPENHQESKQV